MRSSVFMLLVASLLFGCQRGAPNKDLAEVTALKHQVDSCLSMVESLDMEQLQAVSDAVGKEKSFMNRHNQDTLAQEEAIFLANYFRYQSKPLARILKGHKSMVRELRRTSGQLKALHEDMENGMLKEEEYATYLVKEREFAEQHIEQGLEMVKDHGLVMSRYEEEHEQVVEYVNSHRKNSNLQ